MAHTFIQTNEKNILKFGFATAYQKNKSPKLVL